MQFKNGNHCLTFLFLILALTACKNSGTKKRSAKKHVTKTEIAKGYDSLITTPCAVLIYPTLYQIDTMKKHQGEDFYTGADDYEYYMSQSGSFLDSVKEKQVIKSAKGILAFKTNTGEIFRLKLDTLYWSILLFNGRSAPVKADITAFGDNYKKYMTN